MASRLKQLTRRYLPWLRSARAYRQAPIAGIRVHYKRHLDGGGRSFGQGFIPFLQAHNMPRQPRVFEWCAGPGFIGFSLLAHGLCDKLCLADINPEAVAACRRTIADNGLSGQVSVYQSDNLASIPATERWDLVVANPPHFDDDEYRGELRTHDPGWRIHREFFRTVTPFLQPGGVIVLQENNSGSTAETFRGMIEEAGLKIAFVQGCEPTITAHSRFFYIGIVRAGDNVPAWAKTG